MMQQRLSELTAKIEPFDSFWEGPENIEKGYKKFYAFYMDNYFKLLPADKNIEILVVSCGPGYFVEMLNKNGYMNVKGIDSIQNKITHAQKRGLKCELQEAFPFLELHSNEYDLIFCEQEVNHLTKSEIMEFLDLCENSLKSKGKLIMHALNGANPITGSEALAQNFDHYNSFTEYTFHQILEFKGFNNINIFPLNLYVFYTNPLNYVLILISKLYEVFFNVSFIMYGKKNRLWTKKIGAVCIKGN